MQIKDNQGSVTHWSGVMFFSNFSPNLETKTSTEKADESKWDLQFDREKTCEGRFTWQKLSWLVQRQAGKTLCRHSGFFPLR